MSAEKPVPAKLSSTLQSGADAMAAVLTRISGQDWKLDQIALSRRCDAELEKLLGDYAEVRYGNYFTAPGAAFLVVAPRRAAMRLTNKFSSRYADPIDAIEQREPTVVAEVANIVINPFVTALASAAQMRLLLSPPEIVTKPARDLLAALPLRLTRPEDSPAACYIRLACAAWECDLAVILALEADFAAVFS